VRKLSKDNINGLFVPVPLSGHEADPKEPAAVFDVCQQILAYSKQLASEAVTPFLIEKLTGGSPDVISKTRQYFRQKL
jgi:hypothetical protein